MTYGTSARSVRAIDPTAIQANHSFAHVQHVKELGKKFVQELEEFFVNYHDLEGEEYKVLDVKGPTEARRRIEDGIKKRRKKKS